MTINMVTQVKWHQFILQAIGIQINGTLVRSHTDSKLVHDTRIDTDKVIFRLFPNFHQIKAVSSRPYNSSAMIPIKSSREADDDKPEPFGMLP